MSTHSPTSTERLTLRFVRSARTELEDRARRGYPHEACGLLVGRRDASGAAVYEVTESRNLEPIRARDRYTLDPLHLLAVEEDARTRSLDVLGVWHTHPDHPAHPSETDRAAAWEGWSYVIASVERGEVADVRSWRLDGDSFVEEEIAS
ncbi:MAG: M67 family metallopeptidase [Planctomycetota bacterium]